MFPDDSVGPSGKAEGLENAAMTPAEAVAADRRRSVAEGDLSDLQPGSDRRHPDQGRAGPLPHPRLRIAAGTDLGHV